MKNIRSVCVYCGSAKDPKEVYAKAAIALGKGLAEKGVRLVFGGGDTGLMRVVSHACYDAGGEVLGIMTEFFRTYEGENSQVTDLRIVANMHDRKQMMFDEADAFVILPGGFGTLDETFEILTWKQVGMHGKPLIFLDIEGYWSQVFKNGFEHMVTQGFARPQDTKLFSFVDKVDDVWKAILEAPQPDKDFVAKWG